MWQTKDKIVLRHVGGESLLIPTGSRVLDLNGLVTLNQTARCVWEQLDGKHSLEDIADALARRFEVQRDQALEDTREFIARLDEMGLLSHEPSSD
jgi:hypothetical protein